MNGLFQKLNLKDIKRIVLLDQPEELELPLDELRDVEVSRDVADEIDFVLAFAPTRADVTRLADQVLPRLAADAVVWFAYPKGSSKRYKSDYNRDSGWESLGSAGMEAVRQVAIDEDWSALRFRRVGKIKRMTRDPERTLSAEGKSRLAAAPEGPIS